MKGTDIPQAEIERAEKFLQASGNWPLPDSIKKSHLVHMIAGYGISRERDSSVPGKEAAHDGGCEVVSTGTPETGAAAQIGGSAQTWALIHQRLDEYNARVGRVRRQEVAQ